MQAQVTSYLNRARIAAQRDSVLARCEAEPVLERLVRVMRRLNPQIDFTLAVAPNLAFAMEQQDVEETVGNLLENAARFARTRVAVVAVQAAQELQGAAESARRGWIGVTVEDEAGTGARPDRRGAEARQAARREQARHRARPVHRQGDFQRVSG